MSEQTNIFDNAVLLSVEIKSFGTSRKLSQNEYDVDASKEKTRASKKILECDEIKAIRKFDGETRQIIMARSVPSQFRAGTYLIKLSGIQALDEILTIRKDERQALVELFCNRYEQIRYTDSLPADQGGLGGCFRHEDYPAVDKVRESFQMTYHYTEMSAPGRLRDFSVELFRREQEKAAEIWRNAVEEGKTLLREQFNGILSHLLDRLTPNVDGTRKVFRDSLVENAVDFLNNLESRDLSNDTELLSLADEMKQAFQNITPNDLRKSDSAKNAITETANRIKVQVDSLLVTAPTRRIELDEL